MRFSWTCLCNNICRLFTGHMFERRYSGVAIFVRCFCLNICLTIAGVCYWLGLSHASIFSSIYLCVFFNGQFSGALARSTIFMHNWSGNDVDASLMRVCRSVVFASVSRRLSMLHVSISRWSIFVLKRCYARIMNFCSRGRPSTQ